MEDRAAVPSARVKVIQAAISAIEAHGPNVGMNQISEVAGIQRPNLYRLFPSKEALDTEVVALAGAELVSSVRPHLVTSGTALHIVQGVVTPVVAWAAEHPQLYRFLAAQKQTRTLHRIRTGRSRYLSEILEAIHRFMRHQGLPPHVPDGVLAGLMGMVDAAILWWLDYQDEDRQALIDRLSRHIVLVFVDVARQSGLDVDEHMQFASAAVHHQPSAQN